MLLPTRLRPISSLRALHRSWRSHAGATDPARTGEPLFGRLSEVVRHTWYLGFTSFGGPPVHFQIFHARFVEQEKWVDEQTVGMHGFDVQYRQGLTGKSIKNSSLSVRACRDRVRPRCYSAWRCFTLVSSRPYWHLSSGGTSTALIASFVIRNDGLISLLVFPAQSGCMPYLSACNGSTRHCRRQSTLFSPV